jgi:hypothetical protein
MLNRTVVMLMTLGACLGTAGAARAQEPKAPAPRKIPGITAEDERPHGCVDCHKNDPARKMDHRLSTHMEAWLEGAPKELAAMAQDAAPRSMEIKGKHPKIKADLTTADIPDKCLACHAKHPRNEKEGPPFSRLMHRIHLTGGEENRFLTYYQGECTYCHKLDQKTGHWELASGTETP